MLICFVVLIALPATLISLLHSRSVQQYLCNVATEWLSREMGTTVTVGAIDVSFFLDVELQDVLVLDQHQNPLLYAGSIKASVDDIDLDNKRIDLGEVTLDAAFFALMKYKGEQNLNVQFIADFIKQRMTMKERPIEHITLKSLNIRDTRFVFNNQNMKHQPRGMDYGYVDILITELRADGFTVDGDIIGGHIRNLSGKEKNGFELKHFAANVCVGPHALRARDVKVITPSTYLSLDLRFCYNQWKDYNHWVERVFMEANIRESRLNMADIGCFAKELSGMNEIVKINGHVAGRVDSLGTDGLYIHYGRHTRFAGRGLITGLPDVHNLWFSASINQLSTYYQDIAAFDIPDGHGGKLAFEIPRALVELGRISLSGQCAGTPRDMDAEVQINTGIGQAAAEIRLFDPSAKGLMHYEGHVTSDQFQLGKLLNVPGTVGSVSMDARVKGSGFTAETAQADVDGIISSFGLKGYQYSNIIVDGNLTSKVFDGALQVRDKNLGLDFNGSVDFSGEVPVYAFYSRISNAHLSELNLIKSDSLNDISCDIKANFSGKNPDDLIGYIAVENASYTDGSQHYQLKSFRLMAMTGLLNHRIFTIKSDYVDATLKGNFYFEELIFASKKFIRSYLPGVSISLDSTFQLTRRQNFDFDITFYNATPLLNYFDKNFSLSTDTELRGDFDSDKNALNLFFHSDLFSYGKIRFNNIESQAVTGEHNIRFTTRCDGVDLTDSIRLEEIRLLADINNDSINFGLNWDNHKKPYNNAADFRGYFTFSENVNTYIGLHPSTFSFMDTTWNIYCGGDVHIDTLGVTIPGLYLISNQQQLEVKGKISKNPADKVRLRFMNFDISDFDELTNSLRFDFDGILDGYVEASNLMQSPSFISDLRIRGLGFNGSKMGDATISSAWDDVRKGIALHMDVLYVGISETSRPVSVSGYIYPTDKKNNFDLAAVVTNFQIKSLNRYFDGVIVVNDGIASGNLTLKGLFRDPELRGTAKAMRTFFTIPYLNTSYAFTHDEIIFEKNSITFSNLIVRDIPRGDTAICHGQVHHKRFHDWVYDIQLYPRKFQALNTTASMNDLFYGRGYVSGYGRITGDEQKVKIDLDIKSEPNSVLYVPMEYTSEVSENNFIYFINKEGKTIVPPKTRHYAGIELNCKLEITDDAEVQIIFDPAVGDRIRGRGKGNLNMVLTPEEKFTMIGEMTVTSGDYLFTFENVLNKKFNIAEGGTISWTGDPYNAELNLKALYHLKASVSSLGFDDKRGSIPVNCIINLTGPLINPSFSFDIDLPQLDEFTRRKYMTVIEQNMTYNFLTLLVVNGFYNPGVSTGGNNAQAAGLLGNIPSEVLSNQMSNWLSQISKDVDIGVNYRPGDAITQREVELALSTQLFNDRVRIESNVGVGGNLTTNTDKSSNIVGDVDVEVRITDQTRLHVFNKSNQQDYFIQEAPYTQGVGIFYRREFDHFSDLFKKKKKKSRGPQKNSSN